MKTYTLIWYDIGGYEHISKISEWFFSEEKQALVFVPPKKSKYTLELKMSTAYFKKNNKAINRALLYNNELHLNENSVTEYKYKTMSKALQKRDIQCDFQSMTEPRHRVIIPLIQSEYLKFEEFCNKNNYDCSIMIKSEKGCSIVCEADVYNRFIYSKV